MKKMLLIVFGFCFSINSAQISVSKVIQESQIASSYENKLYFIDFWATWCGPCVYAKKMLTVLQKQYPKDFYVISISDESESIVKRYLSKRPTELAIAIDDFKNTFSTYNIVSRPQGVLLNAEGEKLWQGHPSDLSSEMVSRFLKKTKVRVSIDEFIKTVYTEVSTEGDYLPLKDFEFNEYEGNISRLEIYDTNEYLKLIGKLNEILGYLTKTYHGQIDVTDNANKTYELYIKKPFKSLQDYSSKLINELNLDLIEKQVNGDVILLSVSSPSFWDTQQFNWGKGGTRYLLGETDITADNISLLELSYLVAEAIQTPIILSSNKEDYLHSLHDWQLHYKYYQFMESNFLDYGISIKKDKKAYTNYIVSKKAP